jgi:AraC-like DNA-binding protein
LHADTTARNDYPRFFVMTSASASVPARYFVLLRDELAAQGVDTTRLLRLAHLEPAHFEQQDARLQPAQVNDLVVAMRQLTGRTDLGFELGRLIKLNSHDILGYGLISCRNLDHVMQLASRYYHVMNELFTMTYRRRGQLGQVVFSPVIAMPLEILRFFFEVIALSVQNQVQMLLGPEVTGYDIRLSMPPPPHHSRYFALGPARFEFDASAVPGVTVLMDDGLLSKPLPMWAPHVVRQVEERCGPRVRPPGPGEQWGEFVVMMLREAQGQQLTLDALARRMQVSVRTIDRCLKRENLQFRDLANKVRIETACRMLISGEATVNKVALRLGFTEPANFSRAFRRFTGLTPSAYRLQVQPTP